MIFCIMTHLICYSASQSSCRLSFFESWGVKAHRDPSRHDSEDFGVMPGLVHLQFKCPCSLRSTPWSLLASYAIVAFVPYSSLSVYHAFSFHATLIRTRPPMMLKTSDSRRGLVSVQFECILRLAPCFLLATCSLVTVFLQQCLDYFQHETDIRMNKHKTTKQLYI